MKNQWPADGLDRLMKAIYAENLVANESEVILIEAAGARTISEPLTLQTPSEAVN